MGRWDATLPYISPGRGLSADCGSGASALRRGRVLGSPRSASPATSSSGSDAGGGGDDELPDVEDIYDWTTPQLAALEAKLAAKAAGAAPKERRLHELVRVELSERRGVEEIGLALMGGRFDMERVPIAAPVPAQEASAGPRQSPTAPRSPRVRPSQAEAQPILTDAPSPSASSRSAPSRACSPSLGKRLSLSSPMTSTASTATQRNSSGGGASLSATDPPGGARGSAAFKPTPVNFDFVIGGSSVKKKKQLARPKKKLQDEKPARQDSRKPPLAPGRQAQDQRNGAGGARQAAGPAKASPASTSGASSRTTSQDARKASKAAPKAVARRPSTSSTTASGSALVTGSVEEAAPRRPSTSSTTASACGLTPGAAQEGLPEKGVSPCQSSPGGSSGPPEGASRLEEVASPGQPDDQLDGEELLDSEAVRLESPVSDEEERRDDMEEEPVEEEEEGAEEEEEEGRPPAELERPGSCRVLPSILCEEPLDSARTAPESCKGAQVIVGHEDEHIPFPSCQALPGAEGATSASSELSRALQDGRRSPVPSSPGPLGHQEANERAPQDDASPLRVSRSSSASSPRCRRPSPCGWEEWVSEGDGAPAGCEAGGSEPSTSPRRCSPPSTRSGMTGSASGYPPEAEVPPHRTAPNTHTAPALATVKGTGAQAKEPSATAPRNTTRARERHARRPPLPHEALKPREAPRMRNELDLMGLDPDLVERGEVTSYVDHFTSAASFFTWGLQQGGEALPKKEQYMREAMQLFQQFCEIIGSLEVQFTDELAPADHATPGATQQALSVMGSRGAGLYGVFLKGIIDKMSDGPVESVPRPLAKAERDVCSLRYYKVVQSRTEVYDIVTRVFHRKTGWEELPHGLGLSNSWNLCWTWSKPKLDYSRLCCWQKVNHFPENKHLTRKDCLKRCIERYTKSSGKHAQFFNICPRTFVLPKEYCLFIECFSKVAEENGELEGGEGKPGLKDAQGRQPKFANLWIMKPAGSSRGRGIQVVNDVGSVHYGELTIIQQYISNPFLLGGYKWDMRTYVTVTSFNPLEAFIYKDGFARFTTVPYTTDAGDIDNKFVHLTNSSIQRHNEDSMLQGDHCDAAAQARQRDAMLGGTKIAFKALRERLRALGVEWSVVWARMIEVILKSLCMAEDHIPNQVNSFELFGYDLLLDTNLRVWLIEVNASPSMGQEHLLDEQVKQPLISDTIDLVDPMAFDRRRLAEVLHRRVERKAGAAGGRQQLDIDVHAVLKGKAPRRFGEMPPHMGNYERIAPSDVCDSILRTRSQLFNKQ